MTAERFHESIAFSFRETATHLTGDRPNIFQETGTRHADIFSFVRILFLGMEIGIDNTPFGFSN